MKEHNVPGICGIDTRALTKIIREKGSILGRIVISNSVPSPENLPALVDPNQRNLVAEVSIKVRTRQKPDVDGNLIFFLVFCSQKPVTYNQKGSPRICVVDCGLKYNQIRCFLNRGARVDIVPWNHRLDDLEFDGLFLSNGPGDPVMCKETVENVRQVLAKGKKPIFGICLGHQLLSVAVGCKSYKMK